MAEEGEERKAERGRRGGRRGRGRGDREMNIDLVFKIINLTPEITFGNVETTWMFTWLPPGHLMSHISHTDGVS